MLLVLLTAALMTLAAAPFGQWYLAWFGLAPLLVASSRLTTMRGALAVAWLGGVVYFAANLWWLWTATIPGTIAIVVYYALFWAMAAGVMRGLGLLGPLSQRAAGMPVRMIGVALVWVACEWLRCYCPSGFPWLPVGTTQTPLLFMCQVADLGGPWIVSFWVVMPSSLVAMWWLHRPERAVFVSGIAAVAVVLAIVAVYGFWRLQTTQTTPGPVVMVVQSNFRHLPGGAATIEPPQLIEYFNALLEKQLISQRADLVVLPESVLPPINDEARKELARSAVAPFLESTHQGLLAIAQKHHTAVLVGGTAVTGWSTQGTEHIGSEIRNSAYLFDAAADPVVTRYDKVHLVRFSERSPLSIGPAWLRQLAMTISAPRAAQPMYAGSLDEMRPFRVRWMFEEDHVAAANVTPFVAPICLENVDPAVVREMIRGGASPYKQAAFIANISNDGWFATQERWQHLQTTVFRCIENRVPMVRSSNTGISAFIDSCGRVKESIAPNGDGVLVRRIGLDGRHTFYTRYGDVFAYACLGIVGVFVVARVVVQFMAKKRGSTDFRPIV